MDIKNKKISKFDFAKALEENDKNAIRLAPKAELHNHGAFGARPEYLNKMGLPFPINLNQITYNGFNPKAGTGFLDIFMKYLNAYTNDQKTLSVLLAGNFENCRATGVTNVSPSILVNLCERLFSKDIGKFIAFLKQYQYDDLKIDWALDISRDYISKHENKEVDAYRRIILDLMNTGFFKAIDLAGTENALADAINNNSNIILKNIYKRANELGIVTRIHAGEQMGKDGAQHIMQCIIDFEPKQIQHGIDIVYDKKIMRIAQRKKIVFNVCPTSNVALGYAKSIREHPIRVMYDNGLSLTVSGEDMLFFKSTTSEEYQKLYNAGALTAKQLDEIRVNSLRIANYD